MLGQVVVQVLHEVVLLRLVGLAVVKVLDVLILQDGFIVQVIVLLGLLGRLSFVTYDEITVKEPGLSTASSLCFASSSSAVSVFRPLRPGNIV